MPAATLIRYRRPSRPRSSTRPDAATPTARGSSTVSATDWDWEKTGGLASVMGSLKIASRGGQNHAVNHETVGALYFKTFGSHVW